MFRNIIGSIIFVAAVFALINFIGNVMVDPTTTAQAPKPLQADVSVAKAAEDEPAAEMTEEAAAEAAAEMAADSDATPEAGENTSIAAMAGDSESGKNIFRKKCLGCHTMGKGEPNRTGPNLWGIVGREKGAVEGYRYSTPMKALGGTWSEADILGFIAGPRTFLPDTKMTFAGIKNDQDRADILDYLMTLKD